MEFKRLVDPNGVTLISRGSRSAPSDVSPHVDHPERVAQEDADCGTPLGYVRRGQRTPWVRCATHGYWVEPPLGFAVISD
jgi:hypothetical protein